jgi:hypothetical protein
LSAAFGGRRLPSCGHSLTVNGVVAGLGNTGLVGQEERDVNATAEGSAARK